MGLFSFLGGLFGLSSAPSQRIEISKASAAAGLPIIYGRRRVTPIKVFKIVSEENGDLGGTAYDHHFITQTNGEQDKDQKNHDWLHRVDVWGQGEITAIENFWVDGDFATHQRFNARPYFRAVSNYGSDSQAAMAGLASISRWTSQHKGLGVAYSWSRFFNSSKKPQFNSEPEVKAQVKGLKVYDPRLDGSLSGGSGDHRVDDKATWEFSENRALLVLDYLMAPYGYGALPGEIDFQSFMQAAEKCDEPMTVPARQTNTTGSPVTNYPDRYWGRYVTVDVGAYYPGYRVNQVGTTQARWHAAAVLDPKTGVVQNLKKLLEGFGWSLTWSNGLLKLRLEDQVSLPDAVFDKDSIMGGWSSEHGMRDGRLNRITVQFKNANKNYEDDTVSWPKKGSEIHDNFVASDGGKDLHTNKTLDTITDFYRAQAHAEYLVRKSRVGYRIQGLKLAPQALLLEPGDVIQLDYPEKGFMGDGDALFFVEKVQITPTLEVSVDLLKYEDSVYNPDARELEPLDTATDTIDLWQDPAAVTDLNVAAFHEAKADGSVISGLNVAWDEPTGTVGVERIEISWREHHSADPEDHTSDGLYTNQAFVSADTTSYRITGLPDDRRYDVQVIYWTQRGQASDPAVQTIDLVAANSKLDSIEEGATRIYYQGDYVDENVPYVKGDVVTFNGSTYLFTADTPATGVDPTDTDFWALLAEAGTPVIVEYSAENPPSDPQVDSEWHTNFDPAGDLYMRQSTPSGGWTSAIRIVGEAGDAGPYTDYRFTRSDTTPSRNAGSSNPGASWEDAPPTGSSLLWMISARKTADGSLASGVTWSEPALLTGDPGEQGPQGDQGDAGADGNWTYVGQVGYKPSTGGTDYNAGIGFYGFSGGVPDKSVSAKVILANGTEFVFGSPTSDEDSRAYSNTTVAGIFEVYVVLCISGAKPFTHSSGQGNSRLAIAYKYNDGSWKYQKRGVGWTSWPTNDLSDYMVIGTARKNSSNHDWEAFTPNQMTMDAAPQIGAVRDSDTGHIVNRAITATTLVTKTSSQSLSLNLNWQDVSSLKVTKTVDTDTEIIITGAVTCLARVFDESKFSVNLRLTESGAEVQPVLEQVGGKGEMDIQSSPEDWYFSVPFAFKLGGAGASRVYQIQMEFDYPSEGSGNFAYPQSLKVMSGSMLFQENKR